MELLLQGVRFSGSMIISDQWLRVSEWERVECAFGDYTSEDSVWDFKLQRDNAALFAVAHALRNTEIMNCKGEEQ